MEMGKITANRRTAGTAILLTQKRNKMKIAKQLMDIDGRLCQVEIEIGGKKINITNFYGYNNRNKRKRQLRELIVRTKKGTDKMIAGDFNGIDNCELDREPVNIVRDDADARNSMAAMKAIGVTDSFRETNGRKKEYTYFYPADKARLDRIYTSKNIKALKCEHLPCIYTDHDSIMTTKQGKSKVEKGQTAWKNNTQVYERKEFQEGISRRT